MNDLLAWTHSWADHNLDTPPKRLLWFQVIFVVALLTLVYIFNLYFTRQMVVLIAITLLLISGYAPRILLVFSPFILLPLSYDALQGFAAHALYTAHSVDVISLEHALLGFIPTVELQELLYMPGHLHWYDYYFTVLYLAHFVVPIVAALALWIWKRQYYWEFAFTYTLLTYLGFITYLLFPAIPPWLASEHHILTGSVYKILSVVFVHIGVGGFATIYQSVDVNPIAAIPSLHAAYPALLVLFLNRIFGLRWALLGLIYAASVWFGIVYFGEHYVVDAVIGIVYAVISFELITKTVWGVAVRRFGRTAVASEGVVS